MSGHASPDAEPHSDWISKEDWNNYIKEDLLVRPRSSSVVSIFRVPKFLKDTKIEAYVPQRVSLGPYHHRSAELRPMGHHKGRALRGMVESFNTNINLAVPEDIPLRRTMDFEEIVLRRMDFADRAREEILKLDKEIRDSYEENIDCDKETLARMLTLDGCFILEVLRALGKRDRGLEPIFAGNKLQDAAAYDIFKKIKYAHEPIFAGNKLQCAAYDILNDILMLENQVPFIVLRKLRELENVDVQPFRVCSTLLKDILRVFNPFGFHAERFDIKQWYVEQQVHHLLGFLHTAIVSPHFNEGERVDQGDTAIVSPPFNRGERVDHCIFFTGRLPRDDIKSIPRIPRAVELRNAGIEFKPCNGGIKEIKFDSATISLPRICITYSTEIVFRNLIALEICEPFEINYVACYVRLMDELIDSQEDVALLRRMGILINWLGSDQEVADLFNGLCKEVTASMEVFNELRKEVNAHYKNKMKVQFAELVRDHCSSPWKALALAAAIVILLLTVVQTIFSIISVYKGK